jgi:acetyl coenzyme A synthetase (ADP forming)-like protein
MRGPRNNGAAGHRCRRRPGAGGCADERLPRPPRPRLPRRERGRRRAARRLSLHIRPVAAGDRPAIDAFLHALSPEAIGFRFFGAVDLDWAANWAVDVDYADRYALVATSGAEQEIVAHAAYVRTGPGRAEVAFLVSERWQGHGIATIMLAHMAAVAERHGIALFTAEVLPHNRRMIDVFRHSGFPVSERQAGDVVEIELPTSLSPDVLERLEQREQTAAIAALRSFLEPRSVAVIGASRHRRTIGGQILHNLLAGGFSGTVHPVNPNAHTIQGHRAYASVGELPGPVDLAVIAVPAPEVGAVARECGEAGVRALLVISAGFAETGGEGVERQRELLRICREQGMRLIGPNCFGVFNTAPQIQLNATFAESEPLAGRVGFLSQSGGLGIAILQAAGRLGLGLSSFVSVGNKADISGNDMLEYWEHDPGTDVLLLYLESFGNPRRFARIARRVSATKPIVAVKSGRSPAGARATSSHTGALVSASDVTVDALFEQAGVIRTDTLHELFDVAALLCAQPAPRGGRVAIVTNAGGPGIMCADACQAGGLDVVQTSPAVRARLAQKLAPESSLGNPIDMIATASAHDYRGTIEALIEEGACDAIVAIFVPPLVTRGRDVERELRGAAGMARAHGVTLASVFMDGERGASTEGNAGHGDRPAAVRVPRFEFPEDAARALARAARYGRWRERPAGTVVRPPGCRREDAAAILARAAHSGPGWLGPAEVVELLACYGLPLARTRVVRSAREAAAAAEKLGGPVALKAVASGLLHKSDAGGVRLDLDGAGAVRTAAHDIRTAVARAGHHAEGYIVQPMAAPGVELLVGVVNDDSFGPVIACGAGGTSVELLRDVAVRITPLTDIDAREMLRSLHSFPLLDGYRGAAPCDVAALEDVLARVSALVDENPEIVELDANPVVARPDGATILDARVRIAPVPEPRPVPALRA